MKKDRDMGKVSITEKVEKWRESVTGLFQF